MGKRCKVLIVAIMIAAIARNGRNSIARLGKRRQRDSRHYALRNRKRGNRYGGTGFNCRRVGQHTQRFTYFARNHRRHVQRQNQRNFCARQHDDSIFVAGNEQSGNGNGDLLQVCAIRIDSSNYFTVEYSQNGWYTGAAVGDNEGHYRTTKYDNPKNILEEKEEHGGDSTHNSIVYPWAGQKNSPIGKLFLDWDDSGVLTDFDDRS